MVEFCVLNSLHQLVRDVTRPASHNILDLLLTNSPAVIDDLMVVPAPIKTDHRALSCRICFRAEKATPRGERYDFERADYESIGCSLAATNWPLFFSTSASVDEMYTSLVDYLHFLCAVHVPKLHSQTDRLSDLIDQLKEWLQYSSKEEEASILRKLCTESGSKAASTRGGQTLLPRHWWPVPLCKLSFKNALGNRTHHSRWFNP